MIIHGKHKRFELAERHRRQLERKYGKCKILSRRNKAGEDSPRGHYYRFKVPNTNRYYLIVIKYINSKGKESLKDILIVYLAGSNQEQVLDWLYKQDVPNFVFESEVMKFTKGKFTNEEWSWKIRNHRGEL